MFPNRYRTDYAEQTGHGASWWKTKALEQELERILFVL